MLDGVGNVLNKFEFTNSIQFVFGLVGVGVGVEPLGVGVGLASVGVGVGVDEINVNLPRKSKA